MHLFVMEGNEDSGSLPLTMKYLIEELHDVVPEEISLGLPPMRCIQHYIELILDALFTN